MPWVNFCFCCTDPNRLFLFLSLFPSLFRTIRYTRTAASVLKAIIKIDYKSTLNDLSNRYAKIKASSWTTPRSLFTPFPMSMHDQIENSAPASI